jgi:cell division protein FtsW
MPFVSYGGSAMLFNAFGVGVLISISREKKRLSRGKESGEGVQAER